MDDFFSIEAIKSSSGLVMEDDDGCCRYESMKRREKKHDRSCFILGTGLGTLESPLMVKEKLRQSDDKDYELEEERRSKRFYKFLDEWPSSKSTVSTSLFI